MNMCAQKKKCIGSSFSLYHNPILNYVYNCHNLCIEIELVWQFCQNGSYQMHTFIWYATVCSLQKRGWIELANISKNLTYTVCIHFNQIKQISANEKFINNRPLRLPLIRISPHSPSTVSQMWKWLKRRRKSISLKHSLGIPFSDWSFFPK